MNEGVWVLNGGVGMRAAKVCIGVCVRVWMECGCGCGAGAAHRGVQRCE